MMVARMENVTIPRVRGKSILGHLRSFRHDRTGLQLRIGREHPDVASLRLGLVRILMVGSPSMAHEILSDHADSFVKAPGLTVFLKPVLGEGLLSSEGAHHARQRKLLAPAFAHKRIAAYAGVMAERAEAWASSLPGEIDVTEGAMRLTLEIVGKTLFDAEVGSDATDVSEAVTTTMQGVLTQLSSLVPIPPYVPTPRNLEVRRAAAKLDAIVLRMIRARRADPRDRGDVLSMLLAAQHEDGEAMSDRQIRDEVMTLFLAGHETTANALAWTLVLLSDNEAARARVEAEIDALGRVPTYEDLARLPYTLATLKESMRLYPPAYTIGRRAAASVTVGGHRIAKGTIVLINILGIHRRPDLWDDPEAFRPERFLDGREKALPRCAYMPFGDGPRICIGNHFALMEAHVVLATILRGRRFRRVGTAPVELEPLVTLRPKGVVKMRIEPR
jgi:cytochrome P450